jgi:hypothetical protein
MHIIQVEWVYIFNKFILVVYIGCYITIWYICSGCFDDIPMFTNAVYKIWSAIVLRSSAVFHYQTKLNSVALVCDRTVPIERPPLVDEVSANFCG